MSNRSREIGRQRKRYATLWVAALLVLWTAAPASAHRTPLPLALWGTGYTAHAAHCQRVIGWAGARCAILAWAARNACLRTQIGGGTCDVPSADAAVMRAHSAALDAIDGTCAAEDLQALGFSLGLEVDTDADAACNGLENAFVSGIYGPSLRAASTPASASLDCVEATASAVTRILRLAAGARRQALDYIATRNVAPHDDTVLPHEKQTLLARTAARIAHVQRLAQRRIESSCGVDFVTIYGRGVADFLADIAAHVDCLGGAAYVQDAVVCPTPVCGNGIRETGEQCDDGNTIDTDTCHNNCTSNP